MQKVKDAFKLASIEQIAGGLINVTYRATRDSGDVVILQRVSPIFAPEVHHNIEAITSRLSDCGMLTPRIVPSPSGSLWENVDGAIYRQLTCIEGDTYDSGVTAEMAVSATQMIAEFHRCLLDFEYDYVFEREHVHDTRHYFARLRALAEICDRSRDDHRQALTLAEQILEFAQPLPPIWNLPLRHCHGDLKISNLLFEPGRNEALCLIDLDTLGPLTIPYEMGDALRSWCNTSGEDVTEAVVDMEVAEATVRTFAEEMQGALLTEELLAIPDGFWVIAAELAARFCIDAVEDHYFGWDAKRFESRAHHNLLRAQGQLSLAKAARRAAPRLVELTDATLTSRIGG